MGYFRSETHRDHLLRCFSILTFRVFFFFYDIAKQFLRNDKICFWLREMREQSNVLSESELINNAKYFHNFLSNFQRSKFLENRIWTKYNYTPITICFGEYAKNRINRLTTMQNIFFRIFKDPNSSKIVNKIVNKIQPQR